MAWLILEASGVGISGALRQRLWLLLLFMWIAIMALRLLRLGVGEDQRLAPATPGAARV
jgi:hypothetical protein